MQELIEQLRGQGVALATKDGISLAVNSLQPLTEDQRATIRGNKAGILHFLVACERCEHGEHGNKSLAAGRGYTPKAANDPACERVNLVNLETRVLPPEGGYPHEDTPDSLHNAIMRMATHYAYEPEDLAFALRDSANNPQDWWALICADRHADKFVSPAECKKALAECVGAEGEAGAVVIDGNHVAHGGTSCVFRANEGAVEYARLIEHGVGYSEAFSRAADFEDLDTKS